MRYHNENGLSYQEQALLKNKGRSKKQIAWEKLVIELNALKLESNEPQLPKANRTSNPLDLRNISRPSYKS